MLSERVLRVVYFWLPERRVSEGRAGSGGVGGWIVAMAQTNMAVMCECVTAKLLFTQLKGLLHLRVLGLQYKVWTAQKHTHTHTHSSTSL